MPHPMLISGGNFHTAQPLLKHLSDVIDLRMPVQTLRLLEEDANTGMKTSYMDLLDMTVYLPC